MQWHPKLVIMVEFFIYKRRSVCFLNEVILEWSFRSIFGSNVGQICPLSSLTNVYVDLQLSHAKFMFNSNKNKNPWFRNFQTNKLNFNPEPDYSIDQGTTPIIVYDLHNEKRKTSPFSLNCNYDKEKMPSIDGPSPIIAHRYSTGMKMKSRKSIRIVCLFD